MAGTRISQRPTIERPRRTKEARRQQATGPPFSARKGPPRRGDRRLLMVSAASVAGGHWGHLWVLVVGASLCVHGHVSFVLFALEGQVNRVTGWFSTTTAPTPWSRNDACLLYTSPSPRDRTRS